MEQIEQEYIIAIELLKNNQQIMNEKWMLFAMI